jgi:predicted butyrate kinase (DUF1464 family)
MPLRVAGCDPGTSSLDILILEDGIVKDQVRFNPDKLQADQRAPVQWLQERGPYNLIAGPSGYGLPLIKSADCTERDLALMSLMRPNDHGHPQGVLGFSRLVRALWNSGLPVMFLPAVIHMPSVPVHRKLNRIDMGTADKLCVAALALERYAVAAKASMGQTQEEILADNNFCVVELGSNFTACVVVRDGQIVDGLGGTCGPVGWRSVGAWDGEVAYLFSPLCKRDLFAGGVGPLDDPAIGRLRFRESLLHAVAGLHAVSNFQHVIISGRLWEMQPELAAELQQDLSVYWNVYLLSSLPNAWVKHAAQGAALLADGLVGGQQASLIDTLRLREAHGTVLDWLRHPRAAQARVEFGVPAQG